MSKPFYLYNKRISWIINLGFLGWVKIPWLPYMIGINPTPVKNCDCDAPKKRLKYHRKTCASYHNQVLYYRLSPTQRIKSLFVPAEKITDFHLSPPIPKEPQ